jgi:nucleotide-binding universal stress UspA family protein
VHSDALVVAGAHGHGVAKDLLFGSKLELIQSELPNPMVIVGPSAVF